MFKAKARVAGKADVAAELQRVFSLGPGEIIEQVVTGVCALWL